jgi:hypothetical protein
MSPTTLSTPLQAPSPATPALLAARAHAECAAALRIVNRIHAVMPQCGGRDDLAAAMRSLMYAMQQMNAINTGEA